MLSPQSSIGLSTVKVRHLPVVRAAQNSLYAGKLSVACPLVEKPVLLQRCAFCIYGDGLLLKPASNDLVLCCTCPPAKQET